MQPSLAPTRKFSSTVILIIVAIVLVGLAVFFAYRYQNNKPIAASPTPEISFSPTSSPSPTASPIAVATVAPSPSPASSLTTAYTSTVDKLSFSYPTAYRIVDTANEAGQIVQGAYIVISNDANLSTIETSACSGPYMISQIHSPNPFSDFGKTSSWSFIDGPKVSSLTVGGYPAYQITGTYNSQGLGVIPNTPADVTLVNSQIPVQMIACLKTGDTLNTSEYAGILNSLQFTK